MMQRQKGNRPVVRTLVIGGFAVAAVGLMPGTGFAQVCLGSPAGAGQYATGVGFSFADGATGYTLGGGANLQGPLTIGANIGIINIDNVDKNTVTAEVDLAFELPVDNFGVCPVVGAGYLNWRDRIEGSNFDISAVQLPLLLALGMRADLDGGYELIPSGAVGLVYTRKKGKVSAFGLSETDSDSDTAFYGSGGLTVAFNQLFLRGGVAKLFEEGSDPTISLSLGFRF